MDNANPETVEPPSQMSSSNKPMSADTQHLNQPAICQPPKRIPRPKTRMDSIKLYFKLLYERRNMVKMPRISTASFPLFLRSLLACLFYIVTFRQTAWYRLSVELLQQRVEATLPLLKATVQSAACSEGFSETLMKTQLSLLGTRSNEEDYVDEWNIVEFSASLDEHWDRFHPYKATLWNRLEIMMAIGITTFALLESSYQGFEWVNVSSKSPSCLSSIGLNNIQALSPKPSFGVWWEIELMVMPFVCTVFTIILYTSGAFKSISKSYVWYILAGFILACGIWHATHIKLTTKREFMAIEKSWKTRIGGWVFEQQYGIPAPSPNRDQGLDIEAM
ncbi:uncharacterized protein LACBIDRAFT_331867 [Laccaria bicolor S238N-H82]|uniref:Predicted protein n=1 Tax=Laccaria bicolor (strain S238N-H82 / ATCC MYA-4686) TaxID=486041 RepID=B0DQT9_LACBS|nr:uncharacterized protein LACBIDRAFT_331867 [Laccaria bicolor S238N-H82]EDR03176.1 predicted protein [Laccaria bicolor S238N-H82]|eukprot:XP_001886317.1 predicted protein [Laccaria bicolor S238N-H82]